MFRLGAVLLLVLTIAIAWPTQDTRKAQAAITNLTALINGAQQVPPVTTPTTTLGAPRPAAFGTAAFTYDDVANTLTMTTTVFNLDCTGTQTGDANDNLIAAHIHAPGIPGVNGPVVWGFFGAPFNDNNPNDNVVTPFFGGGVGCTIVGKWDAPEGNGTTLPAQIANILAGSAYINFHTNQFPGGEIRGQILPLGAPGADLTATKTSSLAGAGTVNVPFNWTVRVANGGTANAIFVANQALLSDTLPATNITYGAASVVNPTGVTNSAGIACSIAANVLSCISAGGGVSIGPGGSFDVTFSATATAAGTFVNPTGGICRADPANVLAESSELNNDCINTVTVGTATVATPTTGVTATPTVVVPVVPQVIPQVFQNPNAIPAILGGIGNGTRNDTPTPVRPREVGTAGSTGVGLDPGAIVLRPPSTGDAGLARGLGNLWSAF